MTKHVKSITEGDASDRLDYAVYGRLEAEAWSARVLTDHEGRFQFRAPQPGKYLLPVGLVRPSQGRGYFLRAAAMYLPSASASNSATF